MKQVLQSPRNGQVFIADVPVPALRAGFVLVRTAASVISAGTERTMQEFGSRTLVGKAIARPDLVRQAVDKARRDGILATIDAVRNRLDEPTTLGYSAAGTVVSLGEGVRDLAVGTRVSCAGAGFANHAETILVPRNLCVPIPGDIPFEEAAFATVGAIALHGVRLAGVELGQRVAVIGLGIIGLLTVQLARAAGCRVAALDPLDERVDVARELGAELAVSPDESVAAIASWAGPGVDAVLITADTESSEPLKLAGTLARDRGVVVAVGSVGMTVPRRPYYLKELKFLISRSYGPGRYDPSYEIEGKDYPIGYVRWTEGRNLLGFLELIHSGHVKVSPLITHRFAIADALAAYESITTSGKRPLGVVLTYDIQTDQFNTIAIADHASRLRPAPDHVNVGMFGSGAFARSTLLPALKAAGARPVGISSGQGVSAATSAQRFGFEYSTTDERTIIEDSRINCVFIATRHNLHARQVLAARACNKHVFVEKPLCLTFDELDEIVQAYQPSDSPLLMVGFNRRFAPLATSMAGFVGHLSPPFIAEYRVNAGYVPPEHWVHDPVQGGGRIIGEGCHFIDFLSWLLGEQPVTVSAEQLPDQGRYRGDNMSIRLGYPSGSIGLVTYFAVGDARLGKERIEVSGGGCSAVLEDFRVLRTYRAGRQTTKRSMLRADKGHRAQCEAFIRAVRAGSVSPIHKHDIFETMRATFLTLESARSGLPLKLSR